jgi:hypothetical protein
VLDATPPRELGQPLAEELDGLVESLNSLSASVGRRTGNAEADWPYLAWTATAPARRSRSEALTAFFLRLRRSQRLRYKLPRLVFAWASFLAAVCAVVWVAFAGAPG